MKSVVLDASVILKWFLPDETHGQIALGLLHKFITKELTLLSPSLLEYEVINGLIIAQKRARINEEEILMAIQGFFDLQIDLRDLSHFYQRALKYCRVYNRSLYDASYLALAETEGIPLITADRGLYNTVKKDLKWVKWIAEG